MNGVENFKKAFEFVNRGMNAGNIRHDFIQIESHDRTLDSNNFNVFGGISIYGTSDNIWIETNVEASDSLIFGNMQPYVVLRQQLKTILSSVKTSFSIYNNKLGETRAFTPTSNWVLVAYNKKYPEWPVVEYGNLFPYLPNFLDGLSVHYAASLRDHQSYFNHVDITQNSDGLVDYVGTDRHRISLYQTNKVLSISNILIPTKIAKFLYRQKIIDLNQAQYRLSENYRYLFIGDNLTRILIKLGDCAFFPDYERMFLGTESLRAFAVNKKKLLNGLSAVKVPFTKNLIVTFDKQMILKSEGGESEAFLPCQISSGNVVSFIVNYDYFYEAIKSLHGKNVKILTDGGESKIVLTGDDVAQKNLIQPIKKLPQYV